MSRFTLFIILFCLTFPTWAQKLIILHTNDHHGAYMANSNGDFGLAAQAAMVKKIRAQAALEGATVLVLSAGDINTGAPESNMFKAKPDIEAMNAIGYDALVVGNHEFDVTAEELSEQRKLANFEFLGANIKNEDGSDAFGTHVIKDVQGKKIAIVGLTTSETPHMSSAANRPGLKWSDPVKSQRALIKRLKQENDMVIALSHLGFIPDEVSGREFPGDISLARSNPELDIIIGGHSHTELAKPHMVGKTPIFQAKESGQFLGQIEVDLSGPTPKVISSKLLAVKNITPDHAVARLLGHYLKLAGNELNEKVGKLKGKMPGGRGFIKLDDSPIGNLVADSHRVFTNADIGIANARSIRTGLESGDVTLRDLNAVSPFGNTVTYVDLNADEVWKTVDIINENYLKATNQNISFSSGFVIKIDHGAVVEITLHGEAIKKGSAQNYRMAMGNFLSEMATDFSYIKQNPTFVNTGKTEVEAMASYFRSRDTLDIKDMKFKSISDLQTLDNCNSLLLTLP